MDNEVLIKIAAVVDPKKLDAIIGSRISKVRALGSPEKLTNKTAKQLQALKEYYSKIAKGVPLSKGYSKGADFTHRPASRSAGRGIWDLKNYTAYDGPLTSRGIKEL